MSLFNQFSTREYWCLCTCSWPYSIASLICWMTHPFVCTREVYASGLWERERKRVRGCVCKLFVLPVSLTALLSPFLYTPIFLQARIVHPLTFAVRLSDKNECALKTHNCTANAACENTKGSFNCSCNSGFTGNGTVCNGEMHTVRLLSSMVFMNCSSLSDLSCDERE